MFIIALLAQLLDVVLSIVVWVVIAQVIASWLVAFGVVNTRNRVVYGVVDALDRLTAPLLRPIRRVIPPVGGLDLSPLILFLAIDYVIRPVLHHYMPIVYI